MASLTTVQIRTITGLGGVSVPMLENQIIANNWGQRYRAYLSLNCAGELTEPLAGWFSKKDMLKNPPLLAFPFDDEDAIRTFLMEDLGLPIGKRPWSNRGDGEYLVGKTPNLDIFYSDDLEAIDLLKSRFMTNNHARQPLLPFGTKSWFSGVVYD